jgi:DNA-directed RNA polymerase subunit alpha
MVIGVEAASALRSEGKSAEALSGLEKLGKRDRTYEYYYVLGRVQEDVGNYAEAVESYEKALAENDAYRAARFRLAYLCDLRGDEDRAVELYEACVANMPTDVAALLNLGTLYEEKAYVDGEYYDRAVDCYQEALKVVPDHARARLALRDAQAAKVMFYDEDQERRRDRRNQVLEIPVTDFELSVRSRNCLKKMNIRTLGDLIMHTDKDLLSYKNFGETSLMEIREMLVSKGLRLGQGLEDQPGKGVVRPTPSPAAVQTTTANSNISLDSIEFSVRSRKAFGLVGATTLGDLACKSEPELMTIKNFGQTSLNEVKQKLRRYGLSLKD